MSDYGRCVNQPVKHCPDGNTASFHAGWKASASGKTGSGKDWGRHILTPLRVV